MNDTNDGRPYNTDIFLVKLFEANDDKFDRCEAIECWLEGDWETALEYMEEA